MSLAPFPILVFIIAFVYAWIGQACVRQTFAANPSLKRHPIVVSLIVFALWPVLLVAALLRKP